MALLITITDAGRAEIINADNTGTGPVVVAEIGFGTGQYAPSKTQTALTNEVKRVSSIAGQAVAADTIHVVAKDEGSDAYNVGEFGLYSASGTLLAVYSQVAGAGWIIQKAGASTLLLAVDIVLESLAANSLTFGDVTFINPPATTDTPGVVQLEDSLTSTSTSKALTAKQGKALQDGKQPLDATLTALAAIATAPDKLIYSTGPDTFATTTLSAFIRTLLDDANGPAALATLGAAPLASPPFTGTPTAPTPAQATNNTQLATTAFVKAAIAALVDSSPGALDTLNELAAALGDDPNFATTMTNALASKLALTGGTLSGKLIGGGDIAVPLNRYVSFNSADSGLGWGVKEEGATGHLLFQTRAGVGAYEDKIVFTTSGGVMAETAPAGTNNTQLATTAFVKTAIAALVDSSPGALDTLNELAAALGDDPNFATTMTNALAAKQPLDATLTALAALVTAADKLIYSTGSDQFATTTLTAKARSLLASADEAAMRTFLGLVKQVSTTDATAGALLTTGAWGLPDDPNYLALPNTTTADGATDWNTIVKPGWWAKLMAVGAPNAPGGGTGYWYCLVARYGGNVTQLAIPYGTSNPGTIKWRAMYGGVWTNWVEVWHSANLTPAELSPPGAVVHFARSSAPGGWLKANGAAVSRSTYAALYAAIGTTFGAGDGSTTFNLPDLRGEFARGWDDGRGVDAGRAFGSAQADELKSHSHTVDTNWISSDQVGSNIRNTSGTSNLQTKATNATGGSETRPRNVALLACIKY